MNDLEKARRCAQVMSANDSASKALGIEIEIPDAGSAIARMTVSEAMLNGFAVCHGGHIFALADTAFAFACNAYDRLTLAAGASIDFLRPVHAGDALVATAVERQRGGRTSCGSLSPCLTVCIPPERVDLRGYNGACPVGASPAIWAGLIVASL